MKAQLILENGTIFEGKAFGHIKEAIGEVVFNTGMTGYQEVLTDPSNYGQIVTMTYPLIGNYGANLDDLESAGTKVKGLIVREKCTTPNNWRCEFELDEYMKRNRIVGLEGIDTRALTRMIRKEGTMRGIIAVRELTDSMIKSKFESFNNDNAVNEVTSELVRVIPGKGPHIAILDLGIRNSIIRSFQKRDCKLTIFPANTKANEILAANPDGIFISNGPGDPKNLKDIIEQIKQLLGVKPITGICLGHLLLGLALGGDTEKLKYGHRGANQPVRDLIKNRVLITAQNHGYVLKKEGFKPGTQITHLNINDDTVEGLRNDEYGVYSLQFHPEACLGPQDSYGLFDELLSTMMPRA